MVNGVHEETPPVTGGHASLRSSRPLHRLFKGIALSLYWVAAGALLAEGAVRLFLPPPERVTIKVSADLDRRLAAENKDPKSMGYRGAVNALFIKTPTGRRLRASTEVFIESQALSKRTVTLRTNSLGFRSPELGGKSRTRVLFLGDSITMAPYLPEEETFVRLVEDLSLESGEPLQTINAGVGGIGLEAELAILRETGLRTDPDLVVLDFYLNDVQESPGVWILHVPRLMRWSWLAQHLAHAIPRLAPREDQEISKQETGTWLNDLLNDFPAGPGVPSRDPPAFNGMIQDRYQDWGSAWSAGAWKRIEPLLTEFKRQSDVHGFKLLIVCFPVAAQVEADFVYDHPQRRLLTVAGRLGVPTLDLLPLLREARRRSAGPFFYDECHHTPEGSRRIAEWILEFIRQNPAR